MASRSASVGRLIAAPWPSAVLRPVREGYLPRFLRESAYALGRGHGIDRFKDSLVHGVLKGDRRVFVEVCLRPEEETIEKARDGHGKDRRFEPPVAEADDRADEE